MRKEIMKEVSFCDECGREAYVHTCGKCGKDYCYECEKNYIEYKAGVFHSGDDGTYCLDCDSELLARKSDPIHAAYLRIKHLRMEHISWWEDFERRAKEADANLRDLKSGKKDKADR